MRTTYKLTLDEANQIIETCKSKALQMGIDMDIAVTDDGGNLIAFQRMDLAKITSITIAIDKAFTAAAARKATREYGDASQPGKPAYGIDSCLGGRVVVIAGGLPIFAGDEIVGGIGVSSGAPGQDEEVAQAGLDYFLSSISTT